MENAPSGTCRKPALEVTQGTGFWRPSATVPPEGGAAGSYWVLSKPPRVQGATPLPS